ncbi:MAG: hypothetical protein J7455_12100 [Roseiflexus sp.]|jgi:ABC-type transport system substrate-binding protein|nr:hypothetical protein [Roseiflexus sp.]MBO9342669.1 hypothetical protein [Roseiflexus sp.]MBO9364489.1 hypothetical protein [Roseiflexus sp.]MBO9380899.1 hypothetical protein [Roseiflexus sp.]
MRNVPTPRNPFNPYLNVKNVQYLLFLFNAQRIGINQTFTNSPRCFDQRRFRRFVNHAINCGKTLQFCVDRLDLLLARFQ